MRLDRGNQGFWDTTLLFHELKLVEILVALASNPGGCFRQANLHQNSRK